jgi:hypothetical protein
VARLTYYVVLPFFRTSDGEVLVDEPIEVSDADRARRQAERVARSKGGAGRKQHCSREWSLQGRSVPRYVG